MCRCCTLSELTLSVRVLCDVVQWMWMYIHHTHSALLETIISNLIALNSSVSRVTWEAPNRVSVLNARIHTHFLYVCVGVNGNNTSNATDA